MTDPVVIAIDGPSGAGKGAVTQHLAQRTGFHVLDSGALYRLTGFAARLDGLELTDAAHARCALYAKTGWRRTV